MQPTQNNQSLLDVAIWHDGTVDNAFDWAVANGLSLTDDLQVEQVLAQPIGVMINKEVADFFIYKKHIPATALTTTANPTMPFGFPYGFPISF